MVILNKIKWIAGISLIFFIILVTNVIDRNNFNKLSNSVTTIYEDRIVASDLIFELSRIIHEKHIAIISNNTSQLGTTNSPSSQALDPLIERYKQTKLSDDEQLVFAELQKEIKIMERKEQEMENLPVGEIFSSIEKINQYLDDLSKIQLQEGKRQVFISDKAKDSINLFTQIEMIFLVVMAVLVQAIILYKPKRIEEK